MLFIDERDRLRPIDRRTGTRCQRCSERLASWMAKPHDGDADMPMCAWCVLYGGSDWGHRMRNEVLAAGVRIRQSALASRNPKKHVPELDERHRLTPDDAEKLMLGVGYTSSHLRGSLLGSVAALREDG
jgi:hypothetical protein